AHRMADPFLQLAVSGLTLLIGLQAFINIAVNLSLVPPKGMTLPFISYGGSSLLATAFTAGLLLAFSRRRPGVYDRFERGVASAFPTMTRRPARGVSRRWPPAGPAATCSRRRRWRSSCAR